MSLVKIDLYGGKYTALHDEGHGGVTVLRYGEAWRNETGDGFILAMIQEIISLREELEIARETGNEREALAYERGLIGGTK
ncbi:hypothetical protein CIL05_07680 [Virgibacillus profundi]|uniref:Uncharacterized protein n=1 Tax=Virgibacillus profundi TaxID=2024555 RepID=A0A2A2IFL4_9BACI|nr:hypothetical protein [Virgibacillus profundi]PAV30342.1 hypothetical protein CIL05_07680 [Virgibacillus profundi]PXY54514.1 hypothetical protein CIT14_07765 [Virgibacillus profundi]